MIVVQHELAPQRAVINERFPYEEAVAKARLYAEHKISEDTKDKGDAGTSQTAL